MPLSLLNPFTLQNVFLELAVSEHCAILRLNVQPAKTFKWHTTVQNVCICVWGRCSDVGSPSGDGETLHLTGHWETAAEQEPFSNKRWAASWHFGGNFMFEELANVLLKCQENKLQNHKCVLSFPMWCILAKTEQHYQNICSASKSQQQLSNKPVWSQSILPSSLCEKGVWVPPTCSQVSCPVLSIPSFLNSVQRDIYPHVVWKIPI